MKKTAKVEITVECNPDNCGGCNLHRTLWDGTGGICGLFNKKLRLMSNKFAKRCAECLKTFK